MNIVHNSVRILSSVLPCTVVWAFLNAGAALAADPVIHVTWDEVPPPIPNLHYFVSTDPPGSSEFPDVMLVEGSLTWRIWSTDPDNPDNIGDIGVISSPHAENFGVRILDDEDGPGARTVKGIILDPQGEGSDENFSNLVDGSITGHLTGDLFLQQATGGEGGTATLAVSAYAHGHITIPKVLDVQLGEAWGTVEIHEVLAGGTLEIGSVCGGSLHINEVCPDGTVRITRSLFEGTVSIDHMTSALFWVRQLIDGQISVWQMLGGYVLVKWHVDPDSNLKITELGNASPDDTPYVSVHTLQGGLHLGGGVPDGAWVRMEYLEGNVYLYGADVAGDLSVEQGATGEIIDGGDVSGYVRLMRFGLFEGSARFASVTPTGEIALWSFGHTSLAGTIDLAGDMAGTVYVEGDIEAPQGMVWIGGDLSGDLTVGRDVNGSIRVGDHITGTIAVGRDVAGEIIANADYGTTGDISGVVTADGEFTGDICAANMYAGEELPVGVDLNFVVGSGRVCGWEVACLDAEECDDGSNCTHDYCVDHWCSHTHNTAQCPDVCPPTPARPPHIAPKNRYLSFNPTNLGAAVALRVEMTASKYFPGSTGVLGWVGDPVEVPNFNCGTIWRVVDEPLYRDWSQDEVIHVGDCEIVPVATYAIQGVEMSGGLESTPLHIQTIAWPDPKYWGDVVAELATGNAGWTPPNEVVNITDVQAAVNGFEGVNNPADTWVDVEPEVPDGDVSMADVHLIVLAYQGDPYPFGDPAQCDDERGEDGDVEASPASTAFSLLAGSTGATVVPVEVYLDSVADLAAYQITLDIIGGDASGLELERLFIDRERGDYAFASVEGIALADEVGGRLGALAIDGGIDVAGPAYLGTFVYRQSNDARSTYEVRVRGGDSFLLDSSAAVIPSALGDSLFIDGETP